MGIEAENQNEEIENEIVNPDVPEGEQVNASGEPGEGDGQDEALEFEIVRTGEDGSQPDNNHRGIRKRINKLNARNEELAKELDGSSQEIEHLKQKNRLLEMAAQGKPVKDVNLPPDPYDYDGVSDPEYQKALSAYTQKQVAAEVQRQAEAGNSLQQKAARDRELEKRQTRHYEEAEALGAKDYEETEDKAIEMLGKSTVNHIISATDKSHLVLYYLGKNPAKAEALAELVERNPVRAMMEVGRLEAELNVQKKAKSTNPTPDPDEPLEGGTPSAGHVHALQKQLDAARAKVGKGGDMNEVLAIKRKAKAAGVSLS